MLTKKKIKIAGMHCKSCQTLIETEVDILPGVKEVKVNLKNNECYLEYDKELVKFTDIKNTIEKFDYKVMDDNGNNQILLPKAAKANAKQWLKSIVIIVALYLVYKILSAIGFLDWINLDTQNMNYGVALLIGVVASMSTCLAVVGAVVISFSAKYQAKEAGFFNRNVKPHLFFHLGRIATFFILGGVLGIIGGWFSLSTSFMAWFTILIAIILAWLGLNIMNVLPSLGSFSFGMPKSLQNHWNKLKESDHWLAPILLGGLTFFLPCGFTQSMQLYAISSGSFITGALSMAFFALGTAPILTGLGIATSKFKNKQNIVFKNAIGLIVIVFAFYTLTTGLALKGITIDFSSAEKTDGIQSSNISMYEQVINMDITYGGFEPSVFSLKKDIPVKWVIDGKQVTGCTNQIIVPDLDIRKDISTGQNIVEFTPTKAGTIGFSCWMGMVRGKFIVQ